MFRTSGSSISARAEDGNDGRVQGQGLGIAGREAREFVASSGSCSSSIGFLRLIQKKSDADEIDGSSLLVWFFLDLFASRIPLSLTTASPRLLGEIGFQSRRLDVTYWRWRGVLSITIVPKDLDHPSQEAR
ncbi:hypothetical protein OPV22_013911 [Ensete ventricosum]|uniref:Uncharacterized protein n=1 Tax=Ensete ventricosum TaxID=4639 RepID=A0AAV8R9F1_ENSVE|nr:hypothetical protein OPV22_013911 [Ensete ventricosum]